MERSEAIAKLQQHEAELKRLGVAHLYLFGSTARDAAGNSDVDLFFDHPEGSLGLFELIDVKEAAAPILGRKTDHDPARLASASTRADRGLDVASVLMPTPSAVARLTELQRPPSLSAASLAA